MSTSTTISDNSSSIAALKDFLVSDAVVPECYDYLQTHGFLTALAIAPVSLPESEWMPEIFSQAPRFENTNQQTLILNSLRQLHNSISRTLYSGDGLTLPCPLQLGRQPEQSPLRGWALGFMEAVGMQEDLWFGDDEEEVGELLLPIVLASGLFDDPELNKLARDPKQCPELLADIPDNLNELYLLFRDGDAREGDAE